MNIAEASETIIPAGLGLMPAKYDSPEARCMLLAIGQQESGFKHRRQIKGPARGWWQFEIAGVAGVLNHPSTRNEASRICTFFGYPEDAKILQGAIEHNDLLAVIFARLNLWWLPRRLPALGEIEAAWKDYLDSWRPGKPNRDRWETSYGLAYGTIINKTITG